MWHLCAKQLVALTKKMLPTYYCNDKEGETLPRADGVSRNFISAHCIYV